MSEIQTWRDIPGFFDFQDVYNQAVAEAKNGDILVEVGAFLGKSAAYMAEKIKESGKTLIFCVVDSWDEEEYARWWIDVRRDPPAPWPVEELYGKPLKEAFDYCMAAVGADVSVQVVRKPSVEAAKEFDNALRFVFIDADHRWNGILSDLEAWWPKVQKGGIFAGHDYRVAAWPDVARAVDHTFGPMVERRGTSWVVRK